MNYKYLSSLVHNDEEDMVQEAWLKALEKTKNRPQATTTEDLQENYKHIGGLVTHIFRAEKANRARNKKVALPLTKEVPVWYNMDDPLEECSEEQIEAIKYYLKVTQTGQKLTNGERSKLRRLRKQTGLALRVDEHYDRRTNGTTS